MDQPGCRGEFQILRSYDIQGKLSRLGDKMSLGRQPELLKNSRYIGVRDLGLNPASTNYYVICGTVLNSLKLQFTPL